MIQIVMKPERAPVIHGESLYVATVNRSETLFHVRARNAAEAERKTMIVFRHELKGKFLDFNAGDFPEYDRKENGDESKETAAPEDNRAADQNLAAPGERGECRSGE